jgi:hypothetical protein
MKKLKLKLSGISPMLMQSDRLANPLDPLTRELKKVSGKKNKTEDDYQKMAEIEMKGSLYVADDTVVIPAENIEACLVAGGKASKQGMLVKEAVQVLAESVPLSYTGPKSAAKVAEDPTFRFDKTVVVGGRRVVRARPIFRNWSCEVEVVFDPSRIDPDTLLQIAKTAGLYKGLGTWRPRYGRFNAEVV